MNQQKPSETYRSKQSQFLNPHCCRLIPELLVTILPSWFKSINNKYRSRINPAIGPDVSRRDKASRWSETKPPKRLIARSPIRCLGLAASLWPHFSGVSAGNMNRTQETKVDVMDEHISFKWVDFRGMG